MLVLVTGATGRLGSAVCDALIAAGFEVKGVDRRFAPDTQFKLELVDLRDELSAYRVLEGCDAVVHLANHPNVLAPVNRQVLLAENVAINANVFYGALDLRVRTIVFASSVQVTFARENKLDERDPPQVPYLPLDGELPPNPGRNHYALSKEFGERLLQLVTTQNAELASTALRFPFLIPEHFYQKAKSDPKGLYRWQPPVEECFTYLPMTDAARLVTQVLKHPRPGYRQFFPAQCLRTDELNLAELVQKYYPQAEMRIPLAELTSLIDLGALARDLDWRPADPPLKMTVERW